MSRIDLAVFLNQMGITYIPIALMITMCVFAFQIHRAHQRDQPGASILDKVSSNDRRHFLRMREVQRTAGMFLASMGLFVLLSYVVLPVLPSRLLVAAAMFVAAAICIFNPVLPYFGQFVKIPEKDTVSETASDTSAIDTAFAAKLIPITPDVRAVYEKAWNKVPSAARTKEASTSLLQSMNALLKHIPGSRSSTNGSFLTLTAPLRTFLTTPHFIRDAYEPLRGVPAFEAEYSRYDNNQAAMSADFQEQKKITEKDYPEMINHLIHGTMLQPLMNADVNYNINMETRFEGEWVVAPPKRGKTTFLHYQFFNDVKTDATIILMDSKGDLINPLRSVDFSQFGKEVVIIDPDIKHPLALNPLDVESDKGDALATYRTITLLEGLFSTLSKDAEMTPLQSTLFHAVLTLLIEQVPNPTIFTFKDILKNGYGKYQEHIDRLTDQDAREFFSKAQFDNAIYKETKSQILWRLDHILSNPVIKAMFNSPKTKVSMTKLMDSGNIVIINASKELLGEAGAEFYQRFFITMILAAAQKRSSRKEHEKRAVYFYIDECHTAIKREERIATIINECRSQRIGMTMAHQAIQQIKSADVLGALSDCAIRVANSDEEASQLAPRLRVTPDQLKNLPVGSFAVFVRDTTPGALTLSVPLTLPSSFPQLSLEKQEERAVLMRHRYATEVVRVPEPVRESELQPEPTAEPDLTNVVPHSGTYKFPTAEEPTATPAKFRKKTTKPVDPDDVDEQAS